MILSAPVLVSTLAPATAEVAIPRLGRAPGLEDLLEMAAPGERGRSIVCTPSGLEKAGRQVFMKASWLFRP